MDNQLNLDQLILELEELDPAFKEKRAEVKILLEKLVVAKPDVRIDDHFVRALRTKLINQSKVISKPFYMQFKPLTISLSAVGVFVLLLVVATQLPSGKPGTQVIALGDRAFGTFASGSSASQAPVPLSAANGMGGGGGNESMVADKMMIAPQDFTTYTYVYRGEMPELKDSDLEVFRRVKGFGSNSSAVSALKNSTGGLMDLSKLSNPDLQMFTILENKEFGYSINVDAKEGMVSLYQNYGRWPVTYNQAPLTADDMPADADVLNIANAFLAGYNISRSGYGEPVVQNQWRNQQPVIMEGQTMPTLYAPEVVTVVYPMLVNGVITYDDGGNPQGLSVNVNVRLKKVDSLWNLTGQTYESSNYSAVTDVEKVKEVLKKGGVYGYIAPDATKTVEIEVGQPTRILMRTWMQNPETNEGADVFVPALRFPVISASPAEGGYMRDAVVVPLINDLISPAIGDPGVPTLMVK